MRSFHPHCSSVSVETICFFWMADKARWSAKAADTHSKKQQIEGNLLLAVLSHS